MMSSHTALFDSAVTPPNLKKFHMECWVYPFYSESESMRGPIVVALLQIDFELVFFMLTDSILVPQR